MTAQVSKYGLNGNDLFNKYIYEISLNLSKNVTGINPTSNWCSRL